MKTNCPDSSMQSGNDKRLRQVYMASSMFAFMSLVSLLSPPTADEIIEGIEKNEKYILKSRAITSLFFFLYASILAYGMFDVTFQYRDQFGLLFAGFFGFSAFIFGYILFLSPTYLLLSPEGFTVRTLLRSYSLKWEDMKYFRLILFPFFGKDVAVGYSKSQRTDLWPPWETDTKEFLINDTYGMSAQTLADLLSALQKHFVNSASTKSG